MTVIVVVAKTGSFVRRMQNDLFTNIFSLLCFLLSTFVSSSLIV